ncbi:MAG TPA: tol-pal system protein YbgF [Thermoanaerobaculia bacterium]
MKSRYRFPLLAAAAVAAATGAVGCVSSDDIQGLHRQMNDIESQIQALERKSSSKEEVARLNESVAGQTQQLLKSNADTGVKLDELSNEIERLQGKLEDTNRRLSQLSQQIAETQGDLLRMRGGSAPAPSGTVLPPGAPPTSPSTNPSSSRVGEPMANTQSPPATESVVRPAAGPAELYDTAYADYTKARYALAIQGFQEYLGTYPNTDLSDNAQYWIGESHYAQKKYRDAIVDFDRLLKDFPKSDKAPAALLKKGYALLELGQKAESVVSLQYVIHEYPSSEEARLARARLKSIGVEAR